MKKNVLPFFLALSLFSVAFLYFSTSAPGLVWDPPQTGALLASILDFKYKTLSIESPLFYLVGLVFSSIFSSSIGFARVMNLFSVAAALSFLLVFFLTTKRLSGSDKAAFLSTTSLAVFPFFWDFALYANYHIFSLLCIWLFLFFLIRAQNYFRFIFPALLFFSLSFLTTFYFVIFSVPLAVFIIENRKRIDLKKGLSLFLILVIFLVTLFGVGRYLDFDFGSYFSLYIPKGSIFSCLGENLFSYFVGYFQGFFPVIFVLSLVGFLFWEGESLVLFRSLSIAFLALVFTSFSQFEGVYLPLTSVIFLYAGVGFAVVWNIISELFNTEIGVALENKVFVLVFRLKKKAKLIKHFSLGILIFLVALAIFWKFSERAANVSRKEDREAAQYGNSAWERLEKKSAILVGSSRYLSVLSYMKAVQRDKDVLLIHSLSDILRLEASSHRYANIAVPSSDIYYANVPGINAWYNRLITENKKNWSFYMTLERPSQETNKKVGSWGEYPLVAQEPLYKIKTGN